MNISPYLNFNGDCEAAFNFYAKVLGAEIKSMLRHEGSPMEQHVPAEWRSKIMHATLDVGGQLLFGSDAPPSHYKRAEGTYISLSVASVGDAERVFAALKEGGNVEMPIQQTFWAPRFGSLRDRFGIPWMVSCEH